MPHEHGEGAEYVIDLTHLYREIMRATERRTGMSQSRLEILHELWHVDEMTQADLQRHLGVEGPVITRIVKQLEAAGLVTRRPDPRDNRFTLVAMTPLARRYTEDREDTQFQDEYGEQLLAGLDPAERAQLLRLTRRVLENALRLRQSEQNPAQETAQ
jgi:DNA-binding MarR family transcriptional regulator